MLCPCRAALSILLVISSSRLPPPIELALLWEDDLASPAHGNTDAHPMTTAWN